MLDQISDVFYEEASELLENLEEKLMSLEENPEDMEIVSSIFRTMHTIKGSAGMFGFESISKFTHQIENAFDLLRNGSISVSSELIDLTLKSRDIIYLMLKGDDSEEVQNNATEILDGIKSLISGNGGSISKENSSSSRASTSNTTINPVTETKSPKKVVIEKQMPKESDIGSITKVEREEENIFENIDDAELHTYRITFKPSLTIFQNGTRPSLMVSEITQLGSATVVLFYDNVPPLDSIETTYCYVHWEIILTTSHPRQDIEDVFIFLDSESIFKIEEIEVDGENKRLGEILIERNIVDEEKLKSALNQQMPIGEMLVKKNLATEQDIKTALAEQQHIKNVNTKIQNKTDSAVHQSIRVNSEKLDQLFDLVGELVTFNARLGQCVQNSNNTNLLNLSEQSERLILALRDTTMDMRMLPIGTVFTRFKRLVHDLSRDLSKSIELITEGEETELDKTIIEKLNDPLVHLIRNSVDHGIESPEEREAKGKNSQGIVRLVAQHSGGFVIIRISDDGAGLNKNKIYQKAVDKGIIAPGTELPDNEIYNLIFQPGFSTAEKVSNVSGRGVGMDVVKKDIASLGGSVTVETFPGEGTDFILQIPLTLAIIEGLLVELGVNNYVIPLANIVECMEFTPREGEEDSICSFINARGEYLPYINLREYFEEDTPKPYTQQIIIVNDRGSKLGIVVDRVIGQHQTVIKTLGELYNNIDGISGATVLGDGSVALILDIVKLSNVVKKLGQESGNIKNYV